jgi:hypothetical protein
MRWHGGTSKMSAVRQVVTRITRCALRGLVHLRYLILYCAQKCGNRPSMISFKAANTARLVVTQMGCSHYLFTYLLACLITHSTVQSPSWAANWFAASQEIPRISLLLLLLLLIHLFTYLLTYLLTHLLTYLLSYLFSCLVTYLLQFSCHSVAAVLTPVQTKQMRINIYKRNNTKTQ